MTYYTTGPLIVTEHQDADTGERYAEVRANLNVVGTITQQGQAVGSAPGYRVYTALLFQTGTSAPTATVLENTLGGEVAFARAGEGHYTATLQGAFIAGKTVVFLTGNAISNFGTLVIYARASADVLWIKTIDTGDSFAPEDGRMTSTSIEIRVYE